MIRIYLIFIFFISLLQLQARAETRLFPAAGKQTRVLIIYSSTDVERIHPLIAGFQARYPGVAIEYHDLGTVEIYRRVRREIDAGIPGADLLLSSAMDLQIKLVNDGYGRAHAAVADAGLPRWASWRNEAFGFTLEPAVIVYNRAIAPELAAIKTRFQLANVLRMGDSRLKGRIATYDPARSGLGYLFGTQDAIRSEDFWYLARSMGDAGVRQMASSGAMIDAVASGEVLLAYNVLGSYALARARRNADLAITLLQDYTLVMSRIAVIARTARNPATAGDFIDYLLSRPGQELIAGPASLYAIRNDISGAATAAALKRASGGPLIPIRLGPGLLVYLDRLKRRDFLARWQRSMTGE